MPRPTLLASLLVVLLGRAATADWLIQPPVEAAQVRAASDGRDVILANGLLRRTFRLAPNAATVGLDDLATSTAWLRAVEPEAVLTLDGRTYAVGGLAGQPNRAYLSPAWAAALTNDPASFQFTGWNEGPVAAPFPWKRVRRAAELPWPPPGRVLTLNFRGPDEGTRGLAVAVHHELYDGLPVLGKWLSVSNGTGRAVRLDRFESERLAIVEAESAVDERGDVAWRTPPVSVLSDYMFKGMDLVTGNQVGRWLPDTNYTSQVSYTLRTPCLFVAAPPIGPGVTLAPGETFTSFRLWLVLHDSTERERQGLALRRVHRALAPWSTESPLMMHVRNADRAAFRLAVDQCADVGFEMIIYTFGSGLNAESEDPGYIGRIREDVEYARARGVEVGAYSLFSSRRIDDANDVVNPATGRPGGAIFGNAPCFGSVWGTNYLRRLTNFIAQTGLALLEHDGPYPGDVCASTNHPGHHGLADSQWVQWRMSRDLYAWCRANGIYVNQPDYYFFAGGSKTAMGYREVNWSLPRAQQLIHARQNIHDGTWTKPQTAGWMFVPLTEYHGGGAAATLEPLREHLDDYEGHLANTLGAGVQACWRGPRLYDSEETRALVKRWVAWFRQYRDILESDLVHVRRADGRDIDYLVQVNPRLKHRAFAMIHNPLDVEVRRDVVLPLHYAGLTDAARIREQEGPLRPVTLDRQSRAVVPVTVPARGRTWLVVEAP
ncbi:MAG: alpha-galactosidase [Limisphaerales bacterium]